MREDLELLGGDPRLVWLHRTVSVEMKDGNAAGGIDPEALEVIAAVTREIGGDKSEVILDEIHEVLHRSINPYA